MLRLSLFAWKRRCKTLLSLSLALATTLMPFAPANACDLQPAFVYVLINGIMNARKLDADRSR